MRTEYGVLYIFIIIFLSFRTADRTNCDTTITFMVVQHKVCFKLTTFKFELTEPHLSIDTMTVTGGYFVKQQKYYFTLTRITPTELKRIPIILMNVNSSRYHKTPMDTKAIVVKDPAMMDVVLIFHPVR